MDSRIIREHYIWVIILLSIILPVFSSAEQSVLQWSPNRGMEPKVSVEVQWFKENDFLSIKTNGVGKLQPLSAVMDTFCGTNPALRRKFSDWVSEYQFPRFYHHPAHPAPDGYNVVVSAYHSPYECYQAEFIEWMKTERGQDDFLLPAARKMNPHRGDLIDPVVSDRAAVTDALLQKTFGYAAVAEPDKITFIGDNRVNPLRWICPINEIHHREQPSWAMRLHTKPELFPQTVEILKGAQSEESGKRILLRYEIALQMEDCREELDEYSIQDYLKSGSPDQTDLIRQLYENAQVYAGGASRNGVVLEPIQQKMVEKYVKTRLEPVNFQLSIGINFKERDDRYRLAEFMLCTYNQKPVGVLPEEAGGKGFLATACDAINPLVTDGGNNGAGSWWRLPISVLNHNALTVGGKSSWRGTDYLALQKPELEQTVFKGEIDVTKFYRQSIAAKAFPGQRGFWVDRWVGFEGDVPEFKNPDEEHGVEWAFFIFESHGPLKTVAEVRKLEVVIVE
jgi:hypothetical protein